MLFSWILDEEMITNKNIFLYVCILEGLGYKRKSNFYFWPIKRYLNLLIRGWQRQHEDTVDSELQNKLIRMSPELYRCCKALWDKWCKKGVMKTEGPVWNKNGRWMSRVWNLTVSWLSRLRIQGLRTAWQMADDNQTPLTHRRCYGADRDGHLASSS